MFALFAKTSMPTPAEALEGREFALPTAETHFVNGRPLKGPYPEGTEMAMFGMGCFWGVERMFWTRPGVWVTAVGYGGGYTPNATYQEVCSGRTGHNEVVLVVFDPTQVSYEALVKAFFEAHDPTQGMRQGNDIGTQYRSAIYTLDDAQQNLARQSLAAYQAELTAAGHEQVTTEILPLETFYYAEEYHQQYLAKNPGGYCGIGGTGVSCPVGLDLDQKSA
jgi:peptide-methionine (S)-S-oxide reductase